MSYARFTEVPWANFKCKIVSNVAEFNDGGPSERFAVKTSQYQKRAWQWAMKFRPVNSDSNPLQGKSGKHTIDAFLVTARSMGYDPFLIHDPDDPDRADVSIGTGDGVTTVFYLPTARTSAYFSDYPYDDSSTIVKVATVAVVTANRTIDTDNRKVTLTVAPTLGQAVTISYSFYRLVVLEGDLEWDKESSMWVGVSPQFKEIVRDL